MSVANILHKRSKEFPLSFEITPPLRGENIHSIMSIVDELSKYNPMFIDVTSHPSKLGNNGKSNRKKPGTLPICALIHERYNIISVPHVLCRGFTREETEDFLIDLNYAEINNVMAIRGDDPGYEKYIPIGRSVNKYASDLIEQIQNMNKGIFIDSLGKTEPTNFHVGIAGYPEKHFESIDYDIDIKYLKKKVDLGSEYIITQMFFDNEYFYKFNEICKLNDIHIPIIPGIKILTSKKQLKTISDLFHVKIPVEFESSINSISDEEFKEFCVKWAGDQTIKLLKNGISSVHYYVTHNTEPITNMFKYLYKCM